MMTTVKRALADIYDGDKRALQAIARAIDRNPGITLGIVASAALWAWWMAS